MVFIAVKKWEKTNEEQQTGTAIRRARLFMVLQNIADVYKRKNCDFNGWNIWSK